MRFKYLLLVLGAISMHCHAALYRPATVEDFHRIIGPSPITVVNFVDFNPNQPRPANIANMQKVFKDVSDDTPYDRANSAFISVNLSVLPRLRTSVQGLENAMQDADTIVMLFRQGVALTSNNQPVYKSGVLTKQELSNFIYTHFKSEIDARARQQQPIQPVVYQQPPVVYQEPQVIVQEPVVVRRGGYYPGPRRRWFGPWGGINIGFGGGRGFGRRGGFGPGRGWGRGGRGRGGMGRGGGMRGGGRRR